MGRSRAVPPPADVDPNQSRSKRKRNAMNVENLESATAGQGTSDKALYHCNYCNKDISGKIRIKCVVCSDFDLCVECFSVGAEVYPHKNNHPYRVMDNLSFPFICPDWNADEEILLLEGIEMYGLGNWTEVAEHVGTKSKSQCIDHYNTTYMNSPCFPLPDMSHVMGKNREELLAMAKESEAAKGVSAAGELKVKEESPYPARIKVEDQSKEAPVGSTNGNISSDTSKRIAGIVQGKEDIIKVEDRSVGEKKPRAAGDEGPPATELSGYNSKRQEFEIEYDNDAEHLLADMEFKDTDTDAEREIKLRVLRIYSKRLDERKRRKDFILGRNLLYPDPFLKDLSPDEREICNRYRVFMRFHSKEEHEKLHKSVIEEHRILKRIQDLQEARAAGCRTSAEAELYIEHKKKKEAEENSRKNLQAVGPSGKFLQRANHLKGELDSSPKGGVRGPTIIDSSALANTGLGFSNSFDEWDVTGLVGAELLSEAEKQLCSEIRILPAHYLNILQTISVEYMNGNITKKSDAHGLFNIDPVKVDRVYGMLVKKGMIRP